MNEQRQPRSHAFRQVLAGTVVLLLSQIGLVLARRMVPAVAGPFVATAITVASLLVIAWLGAGRTRHARWAYGWTLAILVLAVSLTPWTSPGPAAWFHNAGSMMWLFPWFLLTLSYDAAPARAACAAEGRATGWLMVGTAAVLGTIVLLGSPLHDLLKRSY